MFDFDTHFNSLESALGQLKKKMYVKINETISRLKKYLYEIRNNLRHRLLVQQLKIDKNSFHINQSIFDIKHLHRSNEVCEVSAFKSKIAKIRKLPPKLTICLRSLSRPIHLLNEFWERFNAFYIRILPVMYSDTQRKLKKPKSSLQNCSWMNLGSLKL